VLRFFPVGVLECNCVIVGDQATGEALVVDPGGHPQLILRALAALGLRCTVILNTHAHLDHVAANAEVKEQTGARLLMHPDDDTLYQSLAAQAAWLGGPEPAPRVAVVDEALRDDTRLRIGSIEGRVIHTPGHSPGSVCLLFDGVAPLLLSGDTLFAGSIGRTDLWGGDGEREIDSLRTRLLPLEDVTRVIPGHGPETTIGHERRFNPFLVER